ncbi:MAG TPA: hypothetical protein VF018_00865 [Acidobacteriaceae bacterium]
MRFAPALNTLFLAFVLVVPGWGAPRHASSRPVVRHPAAHKATSPPGNPHAQRGHIVGAPNSRKHHKWL